VILNSHTYQTDSRPVAGQEEDPVNYSHTVVRRLTAEQLLDAQSQATGVPLEFAGFPKGTRAGQMPLLKTGGRRERAALDQLLVTFGKPPRQVPSECERSSEPAMPQAFALISGPTLQDFIASPDNCLNAILRSDTAAQARLDALFWRVLGRAPTTAERTRLAPILQGTPEQCRPAAEDLLWSLLNAKEFVLRH
jgi:hypothetical protein